MLIAFSTKGPRMTARKDGTRGDETERKTVRVLISSCKQNAKQLNS